MKKTLTANIGGIVFNIDEDAYERLSIYLSKIGNHFAGDEGCSEILSDIENRLAETLQEKLKEGSQVISVGHVEEVIAQLGEPEQIDSETEPGAGSSANEATSKIHRRLYRNPDGAILGGVAGGLAAFFRIDPTLTRLAFVLLTLFAGASIFVYLVMWVIVPRANTTAEKLEMRGERVNISNIEKTIKEELESIKKNVKEFSINAEKAIRDKSINREWGQSIAGSIGTAFSEIVSVVARIVSAVMGLAFTILGLILITALIWLLAGGPISVNSHHGIEPINISSMINLVFADPTTSSLSLISLGVLTAIPVLGMMHAGLILLFGNRARVKYLGRVSLVIWLTGLGLGVYSVASGAGNYMHHRSVVQETSLQPFLADTLHIDVNTASYLNMGLSTTEGEDLDNWELIWVTRDGSRHNRPLVRVVETNDDNVEVVTTKRARGSQPQVARQNAANITYNFTAELNRLVLEPAFTFPEADGWRAQRVTVEILVPGETHLVLSPLLKKTFDVHQVKSIN